MVQAVRAKFSVGNVQPFDTYYQGQQVKGATVSLYAVADGEETNKTWCEATPCGSLTMTINNPAAAEFFKPGTMVFLDISPAT